MLPTRSVFFSANVFSCPPAFINNFINQANIFFRATASKHVKMPACNPRCDSRYCVSGSQAHEAMAKHPELVERYSNESQHIRDAIKTLVHADAGLSQLHWEEIIPLMKKFGNDIALVHHMKFSNLAPPAEVLEEMLMSFNRGIRSLGQIMWVPDAPRVQEYSERTVEMPPHFAHFMGSKHLTPHRPMHFQDLRPQDQAVQAPTPAPRVNITFPKGELLPRRTEQSSSQMQWSPCVSPQIAVGNTPSESQHGLDIVPASSQSPIMPASGAAEIAAYLSASESNGTLSMRRRREPDACSVCKLKKTGCGGRFKHCLKNPANIRSSTITPIRKKCPHAQLSRRAASFPSNQVTRPSFNGEFGQRFPPPFQSLPAADSPYTTVFEENTALDRSAPMFIGAAVSLQHAHTFPPTPPTDEPDGTPDIFATPTLFSTEWFDEIGYHAEYPLDQEYRDGVSGSY